MTTLTHDAPSGDAPLTPGAFSAQLTATLGQPLALDGLLARAPEGWFPEQASTWLLGAAFDARTLILDRLAGALQSGELSSAALHTISLRLTDPEGPYVALTIKALTPDHRVERRAHRDRRFGADLRDTVTARFGSAVSFTLEIDLEPGAQAPEGMGRYGAEKLLDACAYLLDWPDRRREAFTDDLRGYATNALRMMERYPHPTDAHYRPLLEGLDAFLDAHGSVGLLRLARRLTGDIDALIAACPPERSDISVSSASPGSVNP